MCGVCAVLGLFVFFCLFSYLILYVYESVWLWKHLCICPSTSLCGWAGWKLGSDHGLKLGSFSIFPSRLLMLRLCVVCAGGFKG